MSEGRPGRLAAIDLLRGFVMVVMVLDHARDFVHREGLSGDPLDPATTTPWLFGTRWITHFCAPTFVLLAGLSARLQRLRGLPARDLAGYLLRRGAFLVLLEVLVLRWLIWFQFDLAMLAHLQVIWAIGWGMCGLGLCVRLGASPRGCGIAGLAIAVLHNLVPHLVFDFTEAASLRGLFVVLFRKGALQFGDGGPIVFVQYPLVPWLGVMLLGYWLGAAFARPADERRTLLLRVGVLATAAFVVLRALSPYGDPNPFAAGASPLDSVYAFLRVEKYPPSLHFLLLTLGAATLLLALFDRARSDGPGRLLVAIGRVPLFFYVLQWPAVHLVSRLCQWLDGQPVGWDAPSLQQLGAALPPGSGFSLGVVYLAWALCLSVLVPLSLWFLHWKARNGHRAWVHYV